ncbi:carbon-nitrogen hydrolase family protein [Trinickia symbiotica]|uniref:conjugal transfer protein TraB n=1 Tax=Trinickia symbiotica TaxID=863227 RepID=UPI0003A467E0|nr:conjugal transfer protein TraB [Trinickia symbiotica]
MNGAATAASGSAIALLAWYPGHWLLVLLVLPLAWAILPRRACAFALWAGYYMTAARDIPIACERFFSGHHELSNTVALAVGVAFWLAQAALLALPWTILKPDRTASGHAWRAAAATIVTAVPPLGIIGWVSPLHVASDLFPGWQLTGIALGLVTIVIVASVPRFPRAGVAVVPVIIAVLLANFDEPEQHIPEGWIAVSSRFGRLDPSKYRAVFDRSQSAIIAAQAAFAAGAQVVILPEETIGLWRPSTRFWWRPYLTQFVARGQTLVLGADLLSGAGGAHAVSPDEHFRYTDSALVLGDNPGRFDSRQPVPGGLWRPGARVSAELGSIGQHYLIIEGKRVAFSICYEDYLLWPHWRLFVDRPDVLVSMANDWFARDLALAQIQRQSVQSIARLAGAPLLRAVNG